MAEQVTAEVILRTRAGSSILDAREPPTSETIDRYRVEEEVVEEAAQKLNERGIEVVQRGPVSLSISADKTLFERVFQTQLRAGNASAPQGGVVYEAVSPIQVPEDLTGVVAAVVLPTPPVFHP